MKLGKLSKKLNSLDNNLKNKRQLVPVLKYKRLLVAVCWSYKKKHSIRIFWEFFSYPLRFLTTVWFRITNLRFFCIVFAGDKLKRLNFFSSTVWLAELKIILLVWSSPLISHKNVFFIGYSAMPIPSFQLKSDNFSKVELNCVKNDLHWKYLRKSVWICLKKFRNFCS